MHVILSLNSIPNEESTPELPDFPSLPEKEPETQPENPSGNWEQDKEGNWYYYQDGEAATGWVKDADTWYYLEPVSGAMAYNTIIDGYVLGADGAMR